MSSTDLKDLKSIPIQVGKIRKYEYSAHMKHVHENIRYPVMGIVDAYNSVSARHKAMDHIKSKHGAFVMVENLTVKVAK